MSYQLVPIPNAAHVRERPPPYRSRRGRLPRLLLVEDSALARRVVVRALAGAFQVTAVEHAKAALARFQPGAFDLVLSDHHMVAMTGLELLEQLRVIDPFTRRVLMSGSEIPGIEGHLATGVVELWLLKPVDLRAALLALIGRKELFS
ncbi:MAG TPA: response regulator [Polyangiales bacterium]|nr:response regulator [Polyangiales bacterium]